MRNLIWAALATGFLLAGFGVASASDTIRLGGPSSESTIQGGTDTDLVHWRRGYGGHYGRGYYGGYYGRGYYGGGYYARPYYYYPRTYAYYPSYYYTPQYYAPSFYYSPACYGASYNYPIAGETVPPPATTVQGNGYYRGTAPQKYVPPMQPPVNGNGTFQYDGGPRSPVPMPNPEANPNSPRGTIPIDGRLVSLPTEPLGGVSVPFTHVPARTSVPRVTYPAYGE